MMYRWKARIRDVDTALRHRRQCSYTSWAIKTSFSIPNTNFGFVNMAVSLSLTSLDERIFAVSLQKLLLRFELDRGLPFLVCRVGVTTGSGAAAEWLSWILVLLQNSLSMFCSSCVVRVSGSYTPCNACFQKTLNTFPRMKLDCGICKLDYKNDISDGQKQRNRTLKLCWKV